MAWEERPLEHYVKWFLNARHGVAGDKLWAQYVSTRNEVVDEVLPWIAKEAGDLTDHGEKHIADVIDNATLLLGFDNEYRDEWNNAPDHGFSPSEMLVLLAGMLLHDVGNIFGRERHNQKIVDMWKALASWHLWADNEKNVIMDVGRAHSGKSATGSKDTIKPLATSSRYFQKAAVNLGPIAAVIRFADELAEGEQRTSQFLIKKCLIEEGSFIYHQYAKVTRVSPDRKGGRIALTYYINVDDKTYPSDKDELNKFLCDFLKLIYNRAAKLNHERQYARHYAPVLSPFRETSISITFLQNGMPIDVPLEPITLDDMSVTSDGGEIIENHDKSYAIADLVKSILEPAL